MGEMGT